MELLWPWVSVTLADNEVRIRKFYDQDFAYNPGELLCKLIQDNPQ